MEPVSLPLLYRQFIIHVKQRVILTEREGIQRRELFKISDELFSNLQRVATGKLQFSCTEEAVSRILVGLEMEFGEFFHPSSFRLGKTALQL